MAGRPWRGPTAWGRDFKGPLPVVYAAGGDCGGENTNGLLRQYSAQRHRLVRHPGQDLHWVAQVLNDRPPQKD